METKNYIAFEVPKAHVLVESKDKVLILLEKNQDRVFWIDKKQAKCINEFKLAFTASFNLDSYKGKEPYVAIYKNGEKEVVDKIHPTKLEGFFRKVG